MSGAGAALGAVAVPVVCGGAGIPKDGALEAEVPELPLPDEAGGFVQLGCSGTEAVSLCAAAPAAKEAVIAIARGNTRR
ncbi:MAG TPA: hypothetical protein VIM48_08530 [Chthoniobacterales bacterium]